MQDLTINKALMRFRLGSAHRLFVSGYYAPEMDADGKTYCEVVGSGLSQHIAIRDGSVHQTVLNVKFKCTKNGYTFEHPYTVTL